MALSHLRLRRTLTHSASFLRQRSFSAAVVQRSPSLPPSTPTSNSGSPSRTRIVSLGFGPGPHCAQQHRSFQSSLPSLDRRSRVVDEVDSDEVDEVDSDYDDSDDDDPEECLFMGCDHNHWLITMEFPEDPKPTPEGMVETYVQTLAKVVGSVEEAKKRMYACSTTTYTGFQAVMSQEMSENFQGLPGVVFVVPDSYVDPVNKEYGGDKYDNGVITPSPPVIHYGYQRGFNPGQGGSFPPQERRDFSHGQQGNFPNQEPRNLPQGQQAHGGSDYGQGPSSGNGGGYRQDGSDYGQNFAGTSGQNYSSGPREGQPLPQVDDRDSTQIEQGNFNYPSQTGTNQGRYRGLQSPP